MLDLALIRSIIYAYLSGYTEVVAKGCITISRNVFHIYIYTIYIHIYYIHIHLQWDIYTYTYTSKGAGMVLRGGSSAGPAKSDYDYALHHRKMFSFLYNSDKTNDNHFPTLRNILQTCHPTEN